MDHIELLYFVYANVNGLRTHLYIRQLPLLHNKQEEHLKLLKSFWHGIRISNLNYKIWLIDSGTTQSAVSCVVWCFWFKKIDTRSALTTSAMPTRTETRRTIWPYDLTAGDNSGTVISKPSLRGPNYNGWSTNLRLALKARKNFGFADETIPQPVEESEDYEDWIAHNALVVSWMKLTIDENIAASMAHIDNSHEIWKHMQKSFGVKNWATSSTSQNRVGKFSPKNSCYRSILWKAFSTVEEFGWLPESQDHGRA